MERNFLRTLFLSGTKEDFFQRAKPYNDHPTILSIGVSLNVVLSDWMITILLLGNNAGRPNTIHMNSDVCININHFGKPSLYTKWNLQFLKLMDKQLNEMPEVPQNMDNYVRA
ncbi:Flavin-binding monooxygenase family protein [Prunus dulcis]|uniref:Flavin-binding monooxygenase family protein n=1 Tax=Prunus dulcis TaxID=3755 RepID=A0A4Y1RMW2_PRUDU|nr:Flavin-binding monooxygenase family protein [Prunus dulcis]